MRGHAGAAGAPGRASDRPARGAQLREQPLRPLFEQRDEHLVLVREVVVDGADRDARALGDVLDARAVEAALGEHGLGRVEDGVAEEGARLVAATRQPVGARVHRMNPDSSSRVARKGGELTGQTRRSTQLPAAVDPREPRARRARRPQGHVGRLSASWGRSRAA